MNGTVPVRVAVLVAATAMQACQKENVTAVVVAEVIVEPAQAKVVAGENLSFSALVVDEQDMILDGAAVTWSSEDARVMAVDAGGRADAISEGSTRVHASFQGVTGSAGVTVLAAPCEPPYEAPKGKKGDKDGKGKKGKKGKGGKGDDDDDDEDEEGDDDDDDNEGQGDQAGDDDADEPGDDEDDDDDQDPGCQPGLSAVMAAAAVNDQTPP